MTDNEIFNFLKSCGIVYFDNIKIVDAPMFNHNTIEEDGSVLFKNIVVENFLFNDYTISVINNSNNLIFLYRHQDFDKNMISIRMVCMKNHNLLANRRMKLIKLRDLRNENNIKSYNY